MRMFLVSSIVFLQRSCHEMSVIFDYLEYKLPMNLVMLESIIEITEQVDINTVYFYCHPSGMVVGSWRTEMYKTIITQTTASFAPSKTSVKLIISRLILM